MSGDGDASPVDNGGKPEASEPEASKPEASEPKANAKSRTIAIDDETADLLTARASALGIGVAELIAALAGDAVPRQSANRAANQAADETAENPAEPAAARWRDIKAWIDSWGKPDERPRPKLDK